MIRNKDDLYKYIQLDNNWVNESSLKMNIIGNFASYPDKQIKRYLMYLRRQEYYINTANGSKLKGLLALWYERRKNRLGLRLGIEIGPNCFGKGLNLYHSGNIIVNPAVRCGDNCSLHGANCIGNNGKTSEVPLIGNNVDIGFGSVLIGNIAIADDVIIGANAVVNKSFLEPGCTIAGIPARIIKHRGR